jgi:hypothetical protein
LDVNLDGLNDTAKDELFEIGRVNHIRLVKSLPRVFR